MGGGGSTEFSKNDDLIKISKLVIQIQMKSFTVPYSSECLSLHLIVRKFLLCESSMCICTRSYPIINLSLRQNSTKSHQLSTHIQVCFQGRVKMSDHSVTSDDIFEPDKCPFVIVILFPQRVLSQKLVQSFSFRR